MTERTDREMLQHKPRIDSQLNKLMNDFVKTGSEDIGEMLLHMSALIETENIPTGVIDRDQFYYSSEVSTLAKRISELEDSVYGYKKEHHFNARPMVKLNFFQKVFYRVKYKHVFEYLKGMEKDFVKTRPPILKRIFFQERYKPGVSK